MADYYGAELPEELRGEYVDPASARAIAVVVHKELTGKPLPPGATAENTAYSPEDAVAIARALNEDKSNGWEYGNTYNESDPDWQTYDPSQWESSRPAFPVPLNTVPAYRPRAVPLSLPQIYANELDAELEARGRQAVVQRWNDNPIPFRSTSGLPYHSATPHIPPEYTDRPVNACSSSGKGKERASDAESVRSFTTAFELQPLPAINGAGPELRRAHAALEQSEPADTGIIEPPTIHLFASKAQVGQRESPRRRLQQNRLDALKAKLEAARVLTSTANAEHRSEDFQAQNHASSSDSNTSRNQARLPASAFDSFLSTSPHPDVLTRKLNATIAQAEQQQQQTRGVPVPVPLTSSTRRIRSYGKFSRYEEDVRRAATAGGDSSRWPAPATTINHFADPVLAPWNEGEGLKSSVGWARTFLPVDREPETAVAPSPTTLAEPSLVGAILPPSPSEAVPNHAAGHESGSATPEDWEMMSESTVDGEEDEGDDEMDDGCRTPTPTPDRSASLGLVPSSPPAADDSHTQEDAYGGVAFATVPLPASSEPGVRVSADASDVGADGGEIESDASWEMTSPRSSAASLPDRSDEDEVEGMGVQSASGEEDISSSDVESMSGSDWSDIEDDREQAIVIRSSDLPLGSSVPHPKATCQLCSIPIELFNDLSSPPPPSLESPTTPSLSSFTMPPQLERGTRILCPARHPLCAPCISQYIFSMMANGDTGGASGMPCPCCSKNEAWRFDAQEVGRVLVLLD